MKKFIISTTAIIAKLALIYWLALVLGLRSYNPDSSLLSQNWKVYIFLYAPLAIGSERLIITMLELLVKGRKEEDAD